MRYMIVGLGNPGPEYESTRHNVGFMVVDLLGENLRASYWKDEGGAHTAAVRFGDAEILLVKPQTFMNISGKAVAKLAKAYGVALSDIVVIHDDIDLPAETVRAKRDGGHGGHNGLRSLHDELGSDDYLRVRIGVGRPPGRMDPARFVLEPVRGAEQERLTSIVPTAAQCVIHIMERGIESAMQEYNG